MVDSQVRTISSLFTIRVSACDCLVDTAHSDTGREIYTLQIKRLKTGTTQNKQLGHLYAYEAVSGLVEINQTTGAVISSSNVTNAFLSLDLSDVFSIRDFINSHGCFINVPDDEKYHSVNYAEIYTILRRFQLVVSGMTELTLKSPDYNKQFNLLMRLNLGRPHRLSLNGNADYIESCEHPLGLYWYDADSRKYTHYINPEYENMTSFELDELEDYSMYDAFLKKEINLYWQDEFRYDFEEAYTSHDIELDPWAQGMLKIRAFYSCAYPFDTNAKVLIHLLANMVQIDERILSWEKGSFTISKNYDLNSNEVFSDLYRETISKLLSIAIKEEFDVALQQVHPSYNADDMLPAWQINNLYTALYFSIFYTNPKYEMFRQCANPGCKQVFKVKTSNSRKLYCCLACQNSAAQMRHRTRAKKQ